MLLFCVQEIVFSIDAPVYYDKLITVLVDNITSEGGIWGYVVDLLLDKGGGDFLFIP